jgi:WD40 repeat protein
VSAIAFSPDGKLLASGSVGKTIKIWQIGTEEELRSLKTGSVGVTSLKGHSDRINSLAFSPDGKILASGSDDKTIKIWQLATGKLICTLTGHLAAVQSVAFSPNGLMLVSGSWDTTIKIWRYENKFS